MQIPTNVDPFNLSFEGFNKYSSAKNFELLGQSYLSKFASVRIEGDKMVLR